jgi:hypothetical protein
MQGRNVDAVRAVATIALESAGAATQQRGRAACVTASSMREPDRKLRQALPEIALVVRCGLPDRLEHLMGVKWLSGVQQALRLRKREVRRKRLI